MMSGLSLSTRVLQEVYVHGEWVSRSLCLYSGVALLLGMVCRGSVMGLVALHCLLRLLCAYAEQRSLLSAGGISCLTLLISAELTSAITSSLGSTEPIGFGVLFSTPIFSLFVAAIFALEAGELKGRYAKAADMFAFLSTSSLALWVPVLLLSVLWKGAVVEVVCTVFSPVFVDPAVWVANGALFCRRSAEDLEVESPRALVENSCAGSPSAAKMKRVRRVFRPHLVKKSHTQLELRAEVVQYYLFVALLAFRRFPEAALFFALMEDVTYVLFSDSYAVKAQLRKAPTRSCIKSDQPRTPMLSPVVLPLPPTPSSTCESSEGRGGGGAPVSPDDSSIGPCSSESDSAALLATPGELPMCSRELCVSDSGDLAVPQVLPEETAVPFSVRRVVVVDEHGAPRHPREYVADSERETLKGFPRESNTIQTGLRKQPKRLSITQIMQKQAKRMSRTAAPQQKRAFH